MNPSHMSPYGRRRALERQLRTLAGMSLLTASMASLGAVYSLLTDQRWDVSMTLAVIGVIGWMAWGLAGSMLLFQSVGDRHDV